MALFVTCSNSKKPRETVAAFRLHLPLCDYHPTPALLAFVPPPWPQVGYHPSSVWNLGILPCLSTPWRSCRNHRTLEVSGFCECAQRVLLRLWWCLSWVWEGITMGDMIPCSLLDSAALPNPAVRLYYIGPLQQQSCKNLEWKKQLSFAGNDEMLTTESSSLLTCPNDPMLTRRGLTRTCATTTLCFIFCAERFLDGCMTPWISLIAANFKFQSKEL